MSRSESSATLPTALVLALVVLGVVVSFEVVPGVFTIDDNNYLINVIALRQGGVTISNTAGLSPSRELLFFDPTSESRDVRSTPVASSAPPLYGLIALPFSVAGWRGLVALNTLSYLATIALVFGYARRYSTRLRPLGCPPAPARSAAICWSMRWACGRTRSASPCARPQSSLQER